MTKKNNVEIPETAPFGVTLIWGKKGTGKTIAAINSPWEPVLVLDTEMSSLDYWIHQKKLIEMGILTHEFERVDCSTFSLLAKAYYDIVKNKEKTYGTIVIDTAGQWTDWVSEDTWKDANQNVGQITWGKIRTRLRKALLELNENCKLVVLTAHERKYGNDISPRCNPALLEITAVSIRLQRALNERVPAAEFQTSRLPFFPPRISDFSIEKMLPFMGTPSDWSELKEDEVIPEEPVYVPPEEEE